jgi:hypothetical protein
LSRRARADKLGDGDTAGLVDVERDLLHHLRAADQFFEIGLGDLAAADFRRRDFGLFGDDAGGELFGRHFQRIKADDAAILGLHRAVGLDLAFIGCGNVEGDVGGERGLAHARTPGEDDQVGMAAGRPCGRRAIEMPVEMPDSPPSRWIGRSAMSMASDTASLNDWKPPS